MFLPRQLVKSFIVQYGLYVQLCTEVTLSPIHSSTSISITNDKRESFFSYTKPKLSTPVAYMVYERRIKLTVRVADVLIYDRAGNHTYIISVQVGAFILFLPIKCPTGHSGDSSTAMSQHWVDI